MSTLEIPLDEIAVYQPGALNTAISKTTKRIAWFVLLIYFVAVLDRVNIGFAALTMNKALGLSASAFGLGASLFLIGFTIFEVPSNVMLARVGARKWLARIAVTWGLMTIAMMFVTGEKSFYFVRFLIGAAEAGSFPGIILYLTYWFPKSHRARLNAIFLLSIPLSNMVSSPLAASIMALDGQLNLAGWQWLFLVEGFFSVAVGIAAFAYLTDRPAEAKWLSPAEREALQSTLLSEKHSETIGKSSTVYESLTSKPIIILGLMYSGINLSLTTAAFWLPQVLRSTGLSPMGVSLAAAVPFAFGAIAMIFWGRRSDRQNERLFHTLLPALLASAGWGLAAFASGPLALIAAVSLAAIGHFSATAVLWTLPSRFLSGAATASGMAMVGAISSIGSAFGPSIIGFIRDSFGGWTYALLFVSLYLLITPVCVLLLKRWYGDEAGQK